MPLINLKNILSEKTELFAIVSGLTRQLNADVRIEDLHQKLFIGNPDAEEIYREPLTLADEIIGWVKGDEKVSSVARVINLFIQKESEKKSLGKEILILYQDINLIFNFSEKLAQSIGQSSIASMTLDEAMRLIKSDNGLVVLWDAKLQKIDILAAAGKPLFNFDKLEVSLLRNVLQSGQSEIVSDLRDLKSEGLIVYETESIIYAALKVNHRVMGAIILATTDSVQYSAADLKFLITLALQSSSAIESALLYENNIREVRTREEEMRRIYEVTNKFVPHEFIHSLGRKVITDIQLGDQVEKIVTVLFSDIRDYTTLSEQMTPEENFNFVCSFNERMGPIIRANNGFVNQYLGDAIMAIFPFSASDALRAAVEMQKEVGRFNTVRKLSNKPSIKIGVGMHTGPLIMGITGDQNRMDATTISDTVNTASRLESLTKYFKGQIILSEESLKLIADPDFFHLRYLGKVQLKGKHQSIAIYECFSSSEENDIQKKIESLPIFSAGLSDYFGKSFSEAIQKFYQVLEIDPGDLTTRLFLDNSNRFMIDGIPEDWQGVEEMNFK